MAGAARATWKGHLTLGEVVCGVSLYAAISASERVSLHMVNRRSGHRLNRRFVDPETGDEVERDAQVKGYEVASGEYVVLEPEEVAAAMPQGDKTLAIDHFIACDGVDDLYFDRPYFLRPSDEVSETGFAVIREGLRRKKVVALARAVLFRRPRTVLIRAYEDGLIATTLNYDYEVRSAREAFSDIKAVKIKGEMLDLARHIIKTKAGRFEPEGFEDRYQSALAELVRAKMEGRKIAPPKREPAKVVSLLDALRESAGLPEGGAKAPARGRSSSGTKKTAAESSDKTPAKQKASAGKAKSANAAKPKTKTTTRKTATHKSPARKAG